MLRKSRGLETQVNIKGNFEKKSNLSFIIQVYNTIFTIIYFLCTNTDHSFKITTLITLH
jgi:hypothetical protein